MYLNAFYIVSFCNFFQFINFYYITNLHFRHDITLKNIIKSPRSHPLFKHKGHRSTCETPNKRNNGCCKNRATNIAHMRPNAGTIHFRGVALNLVQKMRRWRGSFTFQIRTSHLHEPQGKYRCWQVGDCCVKCSSSVELKCLIKKGKIKRIDRMIGGVKLFALLFWYYPTAQKKSNVIQM